VRAVYVPKRGQSFGIRIKVVSTVSVRTRGESHRFGSTQTRRRNLSACTFSAFGLWIRPPYVPVRASARYNCKLNVFRNTWRTWSPQKTYGQIARTAGCAPGLNGKLHYRRRNPSKLLRVERRANGRGSEYYIYPKPSCQKGNLSF